MKKLVWLTVLFFAFGIAFVSNIVFAVVSNPYKGPAVYGASTDKTNIIAPADYEIISSNIKKDGESVDGYSYSTELSYNQVKEFYSSYNKLANRNQTGALYDCKDNKSLYFVDIKQEKNDKTIVDFAYCK